MTERDQAPAGLTHDMLTREQHESIVGELRAEIALFRAKHTERAREIEEHAQLRADLERARETARIDRLESRKQIERLRAQVDDTVRERDAARAGYDEAIAATKAAWAERDAARAELEALKMAAYKREHGHGHD